MESFHSLRRHEAFRGGHPTELPGVTPAQRGVLLHLVHSGEETTVKNVANALGITSSAATQLIDGLVAHGYVLRETNPADRRRVCLMLSKEVRLQVGKIKKHMLQKFLKLFEALDDKEFSQYLLLNKKIVNRFSKK